MEVAWLKISVNQLFPIVSWGTADWFIASLLPPTTFERLRIHRTFLPWVHLGYVPLNARNACNACKSVPHNDRNRCGRDRNVINDVINRDRIELTTLTVRTWVGVVVVIFAPFIRRYINDG